MKKIILFLLLSTSVFAQKAIYNKTSEAGLFKEYQTKSGNVLKIGDTITIGIPMHGPNFTFLTQGDFQIAPHLSNVKVSISKIRSVGNKKRGYKTYIGFPGYGWNCFIDYESALETGEIKNPFIQ
jgi:hypothetical protein